QRGLQPVHGREHDGARAGPGHLAQDQGRRALPLGVGPAVRPRRGAAGGFDGEGRARARLHRHHLARRDARRGHPLARTRGGPGPHMPPSGPAVAASPWLATESHRAPPPRRNGLWRELTRDRGARLALVLMLVVAAPVLRYLGRGRWFFLDDWDFIANR